jgi:hypothetical protein
MSRSGEIVLVGATWLATAVWMWLRLDETWYPHDDGAFAQSAVRVLDGQLPHREFAELYTGAMTFLNAGVFGLMGEDLFYLRLPVFLLFLAFVPCVYYLARQFVGPVPAVLTALAAVTWGFPVYPVPMPSWYVLLFSVYGAAALVRWLQTSNHRWLFVAGLLGGLAIAFKVTGVYYVVGAVLFLLCCHLGAVDREPVDETVTRSERARLLGPVAAVGLASFVAASVFGSRIGVLEIVNLIAPVAAILAVVLVWPKVTRSRLPAVRTQARRAAIFSCGLIIPLALLSIPYLWAGALGDLVEGVFVSPQSRREYAYLATPGLAELAPAITLIAILLVRPRLQPRRRNLLDAGTAALAVLVLIAAAFSPAGYLLYFSSGRGIAALTVIVGAITLARRGSADARRAELLLLVLALVALTALVQFPHAGPVYYFYVAPFAAIAVVALFGPQPGGGALPAVLLAAFAIFGAAFLDRSSLGDLGVRAPEPQAELHGGNASVRVSPSERRQFAEVVSLLGEHSRGAYTFAGPDLPHVYFLSGLENPTRSLFDFLDTTGSARGQSLVDTLIGRDVTAIAINVEPELSDPLEPATLRALERLFPHHRSVGDIEVRWADGPAATGSLRG